MNLKCPRCEDTFWVCEAHSRLPSDIGPLPVCLPMRGTGEAMS